MRELFSKRIEPSGCALFEALEPAYQSRYTFLPCRRVRGVPGPPGAFRSNGSAYRRAAKNRLKYIRPREHGLQKPVPSVRGWFCARRRPHITTPPKNHKGKAKPPFSFEKSGFVELLGRFELPTSSVPITTFTFCSVSHRLQSLINQGFLCRIFCFGSSLGVTFHSVSPQIHPKPAYAAFGRSFFVPNFSIENRYFLTKQRKILP